MRCLKNFRNAVQFNIFDMIALDTITTIDPDRTMKLSTLDVYSGKYSPLIRLTMIS